MADRDPMQAFYQRHDFPRDDWSPLAFVAEQLGKTCVAVLLAIPCGLTLHAAYPMSYEYVASLCEQAAEARGIEWSDYTTDGMRWTPGWQCAMHWPGATTTIIRQTTWTALAIHGATTVGAVAALYVVLGRAGFTIAVGIGTAFYALLALLAAQEGLSLLLLVTLAGTAFGAAAIVRRWRPRPSVLDPKRYRRRDLRRLPGRPRRRQE